MTHEGYKPMTDREYDKLIAAISAHFLTQELPDNWRDFSLEYLEEFITESATETYEYWHWAGVLSLIEEVAHTAKEFMEKRYNFNKPLWQQETNQ